MKEKPILFSTPMVRAILDGRKTQTRRIVKFPANYDLNLAIGWEVKSHKDTPELYSLWWETNYTLPAFRCPYGNPGDIVWHRGMIPCSGYYYIKGDAEKLPLYLWKIEDEDNPGHYFITWGYSENDDPESIEVEGWHIDTIEWKRPGDVLWVRETWNTLTEYVEKPDYSIMSVRDFVYKADNNRIDKWKPSIFMPKEACRIKLLVKDIRVERLQDITEEDAIAEGVEKKEGIYDHLNGGINKDPVVAYAELWESINGKGSWDKNPWVWRIEFNTIK